jgi:ubiquinone/menaquinone biosynthesis C-methylase UbiE
MSWVEFWDQGPPIYVSDRHKLLHARHVGQDIIRLIGKPDDSVLDYGCGEALYAPDVAGHCGRLILSDAAPTIRAALETRYVHDPRISVASPEAVEELADASLDLVVINSLMQYLAPVDRDHVLRLAHAKLKPAGRLVVADVIPPDLSPLTDAMALLRFAAKGGFILAAFGGLARTALSGYRRLREELGFFTYDAAAFLSHLEAAGFEARQIHPNFGHNQARMTFEAKPIQSP